jgi:hypothetical protein
MSAKYPDLVEQLPRVRRPLSETGRDQPLTRMPLLAYPIDRRSRRAPSRLSSTARPLPGTRRPRSCCHSRRSRSASARTSRSRTSRSRSTSLRSTSSTSTARCVGGGGGFIDRATGSETETSFVCSDCLAVAAAEGAAGAARDPLRKLYRRRGRVWLCQVVGRRLDRGDPAVPRGERQGQLRGPDG